MQDVREALMLARSSDGKLVRRPLSPHLQTYRWPVTMAASILHRASGVALAVGTLLMTWWLVAAATSDSAYGIATGFIGSWLGLLCLFGWTLALSYHLCNGVRHMLWDVGMGFEKARLDRVTWLVFALAILLTLVVWVVGLAAWA